MAYDLDTNSQHQRSSTACEISQYEGRSNTADEFCESVKSSRIQLDVRSSDTDYTEYCGKLIGDRIGAGHLSQDTSYHGQLQATQIRTSREGLLDNSSGAARFIVLGFRHHTLVFILQVLIAGCKATQTFKSCQRHFASISQD